MTRSVLPLLLLAFALPTRAAEPSLAFFEKEVKPLLQQHCVKCHGGEEKIRGGLKLTSRKAVLEGGDTGPAFDAKNPAESLVVKAIEYKHEQYRMPPKGKLPEKDIAVLTKWVMDGVAMPEGGEQNVPKPHVKAGVVTEEAKRYWAYQPIRKPALPTVQNKAWAKSPIDVFVLAKLESNGLSPVSAAEKVTLVRRAYYDLLGLPPTPEQVDGFVNDRSPNAWEKLLDSLLASPHYGEKWGRHWLDVVRFAETNGYERDGPKPHAWRYRDYVIKSFNEDKPYTQFLREQLAGDEQPQGNVEALIGTGFLRLGLWDDEPADKELAVYDGFDDLVTVTGQAFLGMTLNCARCHDHKVDPIPQSDYYSMVAFFRDVRPFSETRGVNSTNSTGDITPPEKRKLYEAELNERQKEIAKVEAVMKPIEDEAIKKMTPKDQLRVDDGMRDEVVKKVPDYLQEEKRREYQRLVDKRRQLKSRPTPSQEFAMCVNNCYRQPPPVHLLARGNPRAPGAEVQPAYPTVLGIPAPESPPASKDAKTSGRRTVLANWLTSPTNPLTARVMVNRVWQYHFGRGIVASANDFGKLGEQPSHPDLLDWLATDFIEGGWTLKRLHKQIMMSNVYQLSSKATDAALAKDPSNAMLWRFNMRRLNAEEVRDSFLSVSGSLNLTLGGTSVYPKIPDEVLAGQSRPGEGWLTSSRDLGNRRSVYVYVKRALQVPVLIAFDQADTDSSCPVRYTTTVPTQALGLLNGEFANDQAAALVGRLAKESKDLDAQVARGIRLTTGRTPAAAEVNRDVEFVKSMQSKHKLDERTALTRYALLLLNANEFVYLD